MPKRIFLAKTWMDSVKKACETPIGIFLNCGVINRGYIWMRGRFTLNNVWQAAAVIAVGPCGMLAGGVWMYHVSCVDCLCGNLGHFSRKITQYLYTHTHRYLKLPPLHKPSHNTHIHCEQNMVAKRTLSNCHRLPLPTPVSTIRKEIT